MTTIPKEKLDKLVDRWESVQSRLAGGPDQDEFIRLSREFSDLDPIVALIRALRETNDELDGLKQIAGEASSDAEMREMAEGEMPAVKERAEDLVRQISIALLPRDAADAKSAIVEVRAGTGGDEAALLAGDLFRMYQRYAAIKGWKAQIISATEAGKGGYREVIANFSGKDVFARL